MKRIIYVMICLCALLSCIERKEYQEALAHAQSILQEHPDSALVSYLMNDMNDMKDRIATFPIGNYLPPT